MPTLLELFQSKKLDNGQTGAQKYEVKNSKENTPSNASGFMNGVVFPLQQIARRNLSDRTGETFVEEEVTGLRILNTIASPQIYGTDIIRLTTQKSNLTEMMIQSANSDLGGPEPNNGIIGGFIKKIESSALKFASSKLGINFPSTLIPTALVNNPSFNTGQGNGGENQTMDILAKIKEGNNGPGTILGKFIQKNAKGTPSQIFSQVLGGGIDFLKSKVHKNLFGAPTEAANNLAVNDYISYSSLYTYTDTVSPWLKDDVFKRNDLSSILVAQQTKAIGDPAVIKTINSTLVPRAEKIPVTQPLNSINNPFPSDSQILQTARTTIKADLASKGLADQKEIGNNQDYPIQSGIDNRITYEDAVDWTADTIETRNDLSSVYKAVMGGASNDTTIYTKEKIVKNSNKDITINPYDDTKKYSKGKIRNSFENVLMGRSSTNNKGDILNTKVSYDEPAEKAKDGTTIDGLDFVALKFTSVAKGASVNFRATITGLGETFTPGWDSSKFLGNPFKFYTYNSIERSVTFDFQVYSLNPVEHIAAWQRLQFLSTLVYPQSYDNNSYFTPPFIKFTLGDLYYNKECFIESLSYTIDDNTPWEVGLNGSIVKDYKLPTIIKVGITLKIVEQRGNTYEKNLYGYYRNKGNSSTPSKFDVQNSINADGTPINQNTKPTTSIVQTTNGGNATKQENPITKSPTSVVVSQPGDPKGIFIESWDGYDLYYKKTSGGAKSKGFAYQGDSIVKQTKEYISVPQNKIVTELKAMLTS